MRSVHEGSLAKCWAAFTSPDQTDAFTPPHTALDIPSPSNHSRGLGAKDCEVTQRTKA